MAVLIEPPNADCSRRATGRHRHWLVALAFLLPFTPPPASGAPEPVHEYQVKAVFIFNFTQFIDWPDSAFPDATAPFVIGVLGDDPFRGSLEEAVRSERVHQRPLVVQHCRTLAEAARCQILFIDRSEHSRMTEVLATLQGHPILTIGEGDDFARRGGMIGLFTQNNKVRFQINVAAARTAGIVISSKLLRAADVIGQPSP